jgi:hypothetical protein
MVGNVEILIIYGMFDLTGADVAPYRKSAHTDGLSRCVCRERLLLMGHLTQ